MINRKRAAKKLLELELDEYEKVLVGLVSKTSVYLNNNLCQYCGGSVSKDRFGVIHVTHKNECPIRYAELLLKLKK
jgi:hypothetical protein